MRKSSLARLMAMNVDPNMMIKDCDSDQECNDKRCVTPELTQQGHVLEKTSKAALAKGESHSLQMHTDNLASRLKDGHQQESHPESADSFSSYFELLLLVGAGLLLVYVVFGSAAGS